MSDENVLAGRDLEIAVAKALGFTIHALGEPPEWFDLRSPEGTHASPYYRTEELLLVREMPGYLTDPVAFASVLAALDGDTCHWSWHKGRDGHDVAIWKQTPLGQWEDPIFHRGHGAAYQEAMCRAYVVWRTA